MALTEEQEKILGDIKDEDLLILIKEEAEHTLTGQAESEEIIINKSNNLFQILIGAFISILAYLLSTYKSTDNFVLYNTGVVLSVFISVSILLLLFVINPRKVRLKGAMPSNILYTDIFNGSQYDKVKFIKNRIFCLDRDITLNYEKQKTRVACYRLAIASIIIGLIYVGFTFAFL